MHRQGLFLGAPAAVAAFLVIVALRSEGGPAGAVNGNSITSPDATGSVGLHASLELDAAGNPVISYSAKSSRGYTLKVLHCGNPTCAEGNAVEAPDREGYPSRPSLALDASGNPVVSYWEGATGDLQVLHCNDPSCGGGDESITVVDTVGDSVSTSLALDNAGNPVVSYSNDLNDDLKLFHCNDPNCAGGDESISAPNAGGTIGVYASLALDASGNPVVSYYNGNADLKLLHCNDPNCTGNNESITAPDIGGRAVVGLFTSLALDHSGYPVVSYYDYTNRDLKVLHCNDPNCSDEGDTITAPDTGGDAGQETSLALDASGNPVVSYMAVDKGTWLRLLHCGNPTCTAGNVISPVTSAELTGNTSLALAADGSPIVGFAGVGEGEDGVHLKVLHCGDPNCSGVIKPTETPPPAAQLGDTNCDKAITSLDALLILQVVAGLANRLPCAVGDVNQDGLTTAVDAALVLQVDAGLIGSLPP